MVQLWRRGNKVSANLVLARRSILFADLLIFTRFCVHSYRPPWLPPSLSFC